jgi:hypothetical protein
MSSESDQHDTHGIRICQQVCQSLHAQLERTILIVDLTGEAGSYDAEDRADRVGLAYGGRCIVQKVAALAKWSAKRLGKFRARYRQGAVTYVLSSTGR